MATVVDLAKDLREFYCCVRKKKNKEGKCEQYGRSAFRNMRSGLQRHLVSPPHNRMIDIRTDKEFQMANQVFEGQLKAMKREGRDVTRHKEAISKEDMRKMYSSGALGIDNPTNLQYKVFLEISLHFGRRGREGWRDLKKTSFEVKKDSHGREYVTMAYQELDKNHRNNEEKTQVMFADPDSDLCPVKSFKLYREKLHKDLECFLQRPNPSYRKTGIWYVKQPVGVHLIGQIMKRISSEADTATQYTNHCIKATTATVLKKAGLQPLDIMAVTGHKNVASLDSYAKGPDMNDRQKMSGILANYGKEDVNNEKENVHNNTRCIALPSASNSSLVKVSSTDVALARSAAVNNISELNMTSNNQNWQSLFAGANFMSSVTINVHINK